MSDATTIARKATPPGPRGRFPSSAGKLHQGEEEVINLPDRFGEPSAAAAWLSLAGCVAALAVSGMIRPAAG
jgi:hypothetical protein